MRVSPMVYEVHRRKDSVRVLPHIPMVHLTKRGNVPRQVHPGAVVPVGVLLTLWHHVGNGRPIWRQQVDVIRRESTKVWSLEVVVESI